MNTAVNLAVHTQHVCVVENGFRFELPLAIGLQLKQFLESLSVKKISGVGEWILSLPPDDRLTVNITLLQ